jgi:hypothetical protein
MAVMDMSKADREALEAIMDRTDPRTVLSVLSEICWAKAQHVLTNWQDKGLAKRWGKVARVMDRASTVPCVDDVP